MILPWDRTVLELVGLPWRGAGLHTLQPLKCFVGQHRGLFGFDLGEINLNGPCIPLAHPLTIIIVHIQPALLICFNLRNPNTFEPVVSGTSAQKGCPH